MNPLLAVDSYKSSHYIQYPRGTTRLHAYLEARKGARYDRTLFFGLQGFLKQYFSKPITKDNVLEAQDFWTRHGEPFDLDGWLHIVNQNEGYLPVKIRAVPEGYVVPVDNALLTVENTDPLVPWIVGYIETMLLRGIWYPTTVATRSYFCKKVIAHYLKQTCDDWRKEINFKLHDFGGRGVSSGESAGIGAAAHLINFLGTDTIEGIEWANRYYNESGTHQMYGFSIPAMEHSTVISWGQGGEVGAFRNMLHNCVSRGHKLIAMVSDSYDLLNAVENIFCGELLEEIKKSGATVVIRPDSGNAVTNNMDIMSIVARKCAADCKTNGKGFLVLPDYFRVIQGDGNDDENDIDGILFALKDAGYSAENIAFGMGGGLLQQPNRDTQRFAYKVSAAEVEGEWRNVQKCPKTDPTKASKAGRLDLVTNCDHSEFETVPLPKHGGGSAMALYYSGHSYSIPYRSFETIRATTADFFDKEE